MVGAIGHFTLQPIWLVQTINFPGAGVRKEAKLTECTNSLSSTVHEISHPPRKSREAQRKATHNEGNNIVHLLLFRDHYVCYRVF